MTVLGLHIGPDGRCVSGCILTQVKFGLTLQVTTAGTEYVTAVVGSVAGLVTYGTTVDYYVVGRCRLVTQVRSL